MKIYRLLQQIYWIFEKELRYALRDTDVLIYSILVPLLIYPGTLIAASEVLLWQVAEARQNLRISIKDPQYIPGHLYSALIHMEGIKLTASTNPGRDLQTGKLDAYVTSEEGKGKDNYSFVTYVGGKKGMLAANKLNEALLAAQSCARAAAYRKYKVPAELLEVCIVKKTSLVPFSPTQTKVESRAPLGILAALLLGILQIGLAAGVTAVCVFAEEKEKKTFETTLSIPVPTFALTAGKWLASSTLALCSGITNIIAMTAAGAVVCLQAQLMQKQDWLSVFAFMMTADARTYWLAAATLLACAALSSALCLLFVSGCRTFKDGQAIVTYPMLCIIALPLVACIPGIEHNPIASWLPFANLLICLKHPQGNSLDVLLALLETSAIVAFSLWSAGRIFFSEKAVLNLAAGLACHPPGQKKGSL
jgi:sodium transport system permease protein